MLFNLLTLDTIANFLTAAAYLWIPYKVWVLMQGRFRTFPEGVLSWLRLFVSFVSACGLHHLIVGIQEVTGHMLHANTPFLVAIDLVMSFVSVWAAFYFGAFIRFVLAMLSTIQNATIDSSHLK